MDIQAFAAELSKQLGCPCRGFAPMKIPKSILGKEKNPTSILDAYQEARQRGAREGFLPLLLDGSEDFMNNFAWKSDGAAKEYRQKLLAEPMLDGATVLAQIAARHKEDYGEDGFEWPDPEIIGEMSGGEGVDRFLGISDYHGSTIPLVLAEIPVKNPWEVFAWLPFGGWNECPGDEEQMAVAKYWHETYGAVPAVMTSAVLEYDLPAPVGREDAMALAMEQYTFCPDIVEQGCGTVGLLADILSKSTKWFFWWD